MEFYRRRFVEVYRIYFFKTTDVYRRRFIEVYRICFKNRIEAYQKFTEVHR